MYCYKVIVKLYMHTCNVKMSSLGVPTLGAAVGYGQYYSVSLPL